MSNSNKKQSGSLELIPWKCGRAEGGMLSIGVSPIESRTRKPNVNLVWFDSCYGSSCSGTYSSSFSSPWCPLHLLSSLAILPKNLIVEDVGVVSQSEFDGSLVVSDPKLFTTIPASTGCKTVLVSWF